MGQREATTRSPPFVPRMFCDARGRAPPSQSGVARAGMEIEVVECSAVDKNYTEHTWRPPRRTVFKLDDNFVYKETTTFRNRETPAFEWYLAIDHLPCPPDVRVILRAGGREKEFTFQPILSHCGGWYTCSMGTDAGLVNIWLFEPGEDYDDDQRVYTVKLTLAHLGDGETEEEWWADGRDEGWVWPGFAQGWEIEGLTLARELERMMNQPPYRTVADVRDEGRPSRQAGRG